MRYFIGCLIKGEVKKYQEGLIDEICEKFDVRNLNDHIPAHFTLKSPFETEDISSVENLLKRFCDKENVSGIEIDGIGSFHKRVIYLGGVFSPDVVETFERLASELKKIEWMKFSRYDLEGDNFHSTLARVKSPEQFRQIMKFLSDKMPRYEISFDNITIFQKRNGKWKIYREFGLK